MCADQLFIMNNAIFHKKYKLIHFDFMVTNLYINPCKDKLLTLLKVSKCQRSWDPKLNERSTYGVVGLNKGYFRKRKLKRRLKLLV